MNFRYVIPFNLAILLLAISSPAAAGDLKWKVPPLPLEARVQIHPIYFECANGDRLISEREISYPVCQGTLPATCTQTITEIFECKNGQFELAHSLTSDPDCSYDYDGTTCELVFELEQPNLVPLDPGPYTDPRWLDKFGR